MFNEIRQDVLLTKYNVTCVEFEILHLRSQLAHSFQEEDKARCNAGLTPGDISILQETSLLLSRQLIFCQ